MLKFRRDFFEVAIFQPIFSYSLLSPSISSSFSTLSLSFAIPIAPFHVSRFIYSAASPSFFFFCFTLLFNPFFATRYSAVLLLARKLCTRASTRNGISVGSSPFFPLSFSLLSPLPLLEAPLLIANMPITVIYKRAPAFSYTRLFPFQISNESFDPSFRSRLPTIPTIDFRFLLSFSYLFPSPLSLA